jgi:hypothetical protein
MLTTDYAFFENPISPLQRSSRKFQRWTDRFIWLINQKGGPRRFSGSSFATFEEARVVVKTKLASLVTAWVANQNSDKLKSA